MSQTLPPPFRPHERLFLNKVINDIKNTIPSQWTFLKAPLEIIQDSLFHKAPEVLYQTWNEIYSFLQDSIPLEKNNNPQWKLDIIKIWDNAIDQFDQIQPAGVQYIPFAPAEATAPPLSEIYTDDTATPPSSFST